MYVKNIKWLNEKIETLEKWKDEHKHTKQMEEEIKMLKSILYEYQYYHEKSVELSWTKNPDRMGK